MEKNFVSRAGQKLQHALEEFDINVDGLVCADLGCNAGGFTDCLLQNGASKVYAVDTGYGALDWNLRNEDRVVAMERTNALHVKLPEKMDFICIDVGWTKQKHILPKALELLQSGGIIVSLLKPHYEADRFVLEKGRVKEDMLDKVVDDVLNDIKNIGIEVKKVIKSPIVGQKGGNVELLLHICG